MHMCMPVKFLFIHESEIGIIMKSNLFLCVITGYSEQIFCCAVIIN